MSKAPRHFLDLFDLPKAELRTIIDASLAMKQARRAGARADKPLEGKTLAMIFDKPSTRTRVSFAVGMRQLGGEAIMLTGAEMQLGRGETIADTARVLSRYVDAIMIRILSHDALMELATYATVPVINGLTRRSHPCQVLADIFTYYEHRGPIKGKTVTRIGDANNMSYTWIQAAEIFGFQFNISTPPGYRLDQAMVAESSRPFVREFDSQACCPTKGLNCRSSPKVDIGPCPGMNATSSPRGKGRALVE